MTAAESAGNREPSFGATGPELERIIANRKSSDLLQGLLELRIGPVRSEFEVFLVWALGTILEVIADRFVNIPGAPFITTGLVVAVMAPVYLVGREIVRRHRSSG